MTIEDISKNTDFIVPEPLNSNTNSIIKVVGVGGGGGNAVGYMYRLGAKDVKFVVCNTDKQALENSPVPDRVLLGHTGLGAGDKPEVALRDAQESIDAINAIFDDHTKMVFITAGMGGGTGTGAAPVVAKAAKDRGVLTVGIVTIPFFFEGRKKIIKALQGAEEIRKHVDALLLINNERLIEIYPDLDFDSAWDKADDTLATAARSISDLITCTDAKINIDFNDVDTTLRNGGSAIISCGEAEGENRVQDAIDQALRSPLLNNTNIFSSKRLLFNLSYSRESTVPFRTGEMIAFTDFVNGIEDVEVIYGVSYDDTLGDKVKVTILASGFEANNAVPELKGPRKPQQSPNPDKATRDEINIIKEQYGANKADDIRIAKARQRYVILTPDQLDDDNIIENLEKSATANRSKESKNSITQSAAPSAQRPATGTGTATPPDSSSVIEF